ncbi:MAG: serine hydrolase domain-containing protein [Acidobacteriota bacterium]|jgi:CubicO group peptidase (beta-lactamase class C family)
MTVRPLVPLLTTASILILITLAPIAALRAEDAGDPAAIEAGPTDPASTGASPIEAAREIAEETAKALPGLSVAVGSGGEIVWSDGFGWADLGTRAEATAETRYPVYSAAKAWTAAAGLRLVGEGRFGLEEPVGTYLPQLPEPLAHATPYQLATHTAGVRHYAEGEAAPDAFHCDSVGEALALFRDDDLLFAPGTGRSYSSWGYVLLSAAIEAAAGEPFVDVLERRVFAPAGMTGTVRADPAAVLPGRAEPYRRLETGGWGRVVGLDVTCKWGAGGFLATAPDLVRFYLALLRGDLLDQRSALLLIRPEDDGSFRFGGFSHGGRSLILGNVRSGVVVALATNARADGVDLDGAAAGILERFEAARDPLPADRETGG